MYGSEAESLASRMGKLEWMHGCLDPFVNVLGYGNGHGIGTALSHLTENVPAASKERMSQAYAESSL